MASNYSTPNLTNNSWLGCSNTHKPHKHTKADAIINMLYNQVNETARVLFGKCLQVPLLLSSLSLTAMAGAVGLVTQY